jgi:hypothetical protein
MRISNFEFRILIVGSVTASFSKRLTPLEFQQSAIGSRHAKRGWSLRQQRNEVQWQSKIYTSEGGAA